MWCISLCSFQIHHQENKATYLPSSAYVPEGFCDNEFDESTAEILMGSIEMLR
jgi:hypothetical protein